MSEPDITEVYASLFKAQTENELLRQQIAELQGTIRWMETQMFGGGSRA